MSRDIVKSSIVYTILGYLPLSFSLIFTPIYLNYMDESDYGILNLFMVYSGILAQVYSLGFKNLFIFKYWDVYKDPTKLKSLVSNTLGSIFFLQLISIVIVYFLASKFLPYIMSNEDFTFYPYFICTIAFAAFMVYFDLLIAFYRNQNQLRNFTAISVGSLVLMTIGSLIGVVWLRMEAEGAIYGRLFGYSIIVLIFLALLLKQYGLSLKISFFKSMLLLAIPIFINNLVGSVAFGIDRLLVEKFMGLNVLGVYGFAVVIVSTLEILFNSLNNALSPSIYKLIQESPMKNKVQINNLGQVHILIIFIGIAVVSLIVHPVLDLLIPEGFHEAAKYVPLLSCALLWRVLTTFEVFSLYKENKTKYFLYNQVSLLIAMILLSYFLFEPFGIGGIVMAVYISRFVEYLVMKQLVKMVMPMPFEFRNIKIGIVLLSLVALACLHFYDQLNHYLLYAIPLLCLILLAITLLRNEFTSFSRVWKLRKEIL